jgi:transposase
MQLGHSKDHRPDLPQLKLMVAAAEPSGHLIGSDLHRGNKADDPLYTPLIRRVRDLLGRRGLLYSGDCKMSALETRAEIQNSGDLYLTPLALTGKQKECFEQWVTLATEGQQPAQLLWDGKTLIGAGYEFERQQSSFSGGLDWCERILLVRSLTLAQTQQQGLHQRLSAATEALLALTPAPGRGKRQIRSLDQLTQRIEQVVKQYGVGQLLKVSWTDHHTTHKRYQGRGRGSPSRPVIETVKTRYVITSVEPLAEQIAQASYRLGWRTLLTNATAQALSLTEAVLHYRGGWSLERDFHLLKDSPLGLSPLFVYKDDQIKGLTRLLTLALRLLTLIELQVHHAIKVNNAEVLGLYEGQPHRTSKRPSARRILRAFDRSEITLTRIHINQESYWRITPLSPLLKMLLGYLALPESLFTLDNSS